jgi:hypothetical protein
MRLGDWVASGDLQRQPAAREEIARLLEIASRDLADAAVPGVSLDRQFAIAYEAALALATIALRAVGYRARGSSSAHHWLILASLPEVMGGDLESRSRYYQACRRKRHQAAYEHAGVATAAELDDLLKDVGGFRRELVAWLRKHHPALAPAAEGETDTAS